MDAPRIDRSALERAPKQGHAWSEQTANPDYVLRGLGIVAVAQDEILDSYRGGGRWIVLSGSDASSRYEVRTGTRPRRDRCECRSFGSHGYCSHVVVASRVAKDSAVCDSCGTRRGWHDLVEVGEGDGLLSWLPGDRLCRACVRSGAWA